MRARAHSVQYNPMCGVCWTLALASTSSSENTVEQLFEKTVLNSMHRIPIRILLTRLVNAPRSAPRHHLALHCLHSIMLRTLLSPHSAPRHKMMHLKNPFFQQHPHPAITLPAYCYRTPLSHPVNAPCYHFVIIPSPHLPMIHNAAPCQHRAVLVIN